MSREDSQQNVHVQRFQVPFEYPVYFTDDVFEPNNPTLVNALGRLEPDRCHRMVAVVDDGLIQARPGIDAALSSYAQVHSDRIEMLMDPISIPGGERAKTDRELVYRIQRDIAEAHLDRQSFVVIVGGGAVHDVAGFAAATAHRGVRVVRVPTTVEGQADSGVGVKNGLNAFGVKNFIGSFAPPFAVINDFSFIESLNERDRRAGLAEAVKVALLRDADFFEWLWNRADLLAACEPQATREAIRRCAALHLEHIAQCGDPFEFGSAKPLDYGHWSAHKIETLSNYELRHGEAVAIGLAIDSRYAAESGMIDEKTLGRICVLLERLGFRLWHGSLVARGDDGRRTIMAGLDEFREHLGGELTLTLIDAVGSMRDITEIDVEMMARAVDWLEFRSLPA